jgi:hypothetical protein
VFTGRGVWYRPAESVFCGGLRTHARRSEEKAVIEEKLRHSGLDPESRIVPSGAKRRKKLIDELDSGSNPE